MRDNSAYSPQTAATACRHDTCRHRGGWVLYWAKNPTSGSFTAISSNGDYTILIRAKLSITGGGIIGFMKKAADSGFWRGRRVFVTGHTGFKGGWLCLWLHLLGAKVGGYALLPQPAKRAGADGVFDAVRLGDMLCANTINDIGDAEGLARAVAGFAPEIVFHLAAQPLVIESYKTPLQTYQTNVCGTANLMHALRDITSIKAAVIITSDKCYDNAERGRPYCESDALGGRDPYSSSKACAEIVARAMAMSFLGDIGVATARAGNVIGGGDWAGDRLIPDIVRMLDGGDSALRIRNPGAVRPWQHVLEPLAGYLQLAQYCAENPKAEVEGWNFGPDEDGAATVGEVAELMAQQWGEKLPKGDDDKNNDGDAYYEAKLLHLDITKAKARLSWKPVLTLPMAVEMTAKWYKAQSSGKTNMRDMTLSQIAEYQAAAA
ncbi:MAG: CDP-glucose 4,6-dehydratase [Gammaproteobacteria bacterium]